MKSNKFWVVVFCLVVVGCVVALLVLERGETSFVRVYKDGKPVTDAVNLVAVTESYTITVGNLVETGGVFDGVSGRNIVEIDVGRVRMLEADCPDGYCVRQGWITGGFVPIVCLPNRVVVVLVGGLNDTGVDAVVG